MSTARNAGVLAATVLASGALLLYPTSLNRASRHGVGRAAPVGVVRPSARPAKAGAPPTREVTVNGASESTPYGPVQVQLVLRDRRIVRAVAIDFPDVGGRDREINSYAIPQLQQETLAAQSAHIDAVSGASYTSDGYTRSLQSALDALPTAEAPSPR